MKLSQPRQARGGSDIYAFHTRLEYADGAGVSENPHRWAVRRQVALSAHPLAQGGFMFMKRALFQPELAVLLASSLLQAQRIDQKTKLEIGEENALMAQRAGVWDVTETVWDAPGAVPTTTKWVAERRMVREFLEEVLEPTVAVPASKIQRIDYLSYHRIEGRWKYVSMDTRASVGLIPAASADRGDDASEKGRLSLPIAFDGVQAKNKKNRVRDSSFSQVPLRARSLQGETRRQGHDDVGKLPGGNRRSPIELGKQFGDKSGHGLHMSAVQFGIGLRERLIPAGL